jgi:myo-inositol-1(or 4)-monophosphatase
MLNIAIRAARAAGDAIVHDLDRMDRVEIHEKGPNDYVSDTDKRAEQRIIKTLLKAYPDHSILAEESGIQGESDYQWIIDPIDGTQNFIRSYPHFAVSIALAVRGKVEQAVIYDPVRQDLFTASKGKGSRLNETRIRTNAKATMGNALIATGFAGRQDPTICDFYEQSLHALLPTVADVRRAGSAALDLAYVAAGRCDGFFEACLKPWDLAAGALIVKEAGGIVSDFQGGENFWHSGHIIATTPSLFKPMLQTLHPLTKKIN